MPDSFYLTTALPYVNASPHIGFALEIVAADVIARAQRAAGKEVIFNTGTDEHGQKIFQQAAEAGQDPQAYTDEYAAKFADLQKLLNLSYTHFIRTTNPDHKQAAQEFWRRCQNNGDIYKHTYRTLYCVGCELEKQTSELDDGKCPLHPTKPLEEREEENYFFRFSRYQAALLELYRNRPEFVKPAAKMKEITAFVQGGLQDFSISRLKEKMSWGVAVPGDDNHVMYVWFDALINYISTLGWPHDLTTFTQFWPGIQLAGKDNLRQQAAMWQAMLMSAQLPASKQILINGFISVEGQKMSKSLGNVIAPSELVARYGQDATRFLLMYLGPFGTDMDVSWSQFDTLYTAHLANGIGNVCSRVAKLCEKAEVNYDQSVSPPAPIAQLRDAILQNYADFELKSAIDHITKLVTLIDESLSTIKPWTLTGETQKEALLNYLVQLHVLFQALAPIMPTTSKLLQSHFEEQPKISALTPLFPRLKP